MLYGFHDILSIYEGGVRLIVRARPGSSRPRSPKIVDLAENKRAVEIAVAAVAEEGKANKAILETLAEELGLKQKDFSIKVGAGGKLKLVEIQGEGKVLGARVENWLEKLATSGS